MKKLISIISLLLVFVFALSGCVNTIDLKIDNAGLVTVTEIVKLNEDEYNDFILGSSEELGDYIDSDISDIIDEFKEETIGGKKYYTLENITEVYADNLNVDSSYDEEFVEDTSLESIFNVRTITENDILLGCSNVSVIAAHLKEASLAVSVTFPEAITVTNGTLSNENKTVTFEGFKRNTNWYAATAKSTAPWATKQTKEEQQQTADEMVAAYMTEKPWTYSCYLTDSRTAYISWDKVSNATQYLLYKRVGNGDFKLYKTLTGTSYNVPVTAGTTTAFTVRAKNNYYTTDFVYWDYLEVTPMSTKTVPSISSAKRSGKYAVIKPKEVKGADGYVVYMSKKNKSGTFKKVGTVYNDNNSLTFKKKLSNGKYYFKVKAFQKVGKYSNKTVYSAKSSKAKSVTIK